MTEVSAYSIQVPQGKLETLREGLRAAPISYAPEGSGWAYGIDTQYLRDVVDYWIADYDWRRWEAHLNRFPMFSTRIDDCDIRFQHIRGSGGRS